MHLQPDATVSPRILRARSRPLHELRASAARLGYALRVRRSRLRAGGAALLKANGAMAASLAFGALNT